MSQRYFRDSLGTDALPALTAAPGALTLPAKNSRTLKEKVSCTLAAAAPNTPLAIESSTFATPIVVTITTHGLLNGQRVYIAGHAVNTAANGTWVVANKTANTFELAGSVGNGIGGATGTATLIQEVTSIVATGEAGTEAELIYIGAAGALGFIDGSNLKLAGIYVPAPSGTICLVCDGTNWYETGRSGN